MKKINFIGKDDDLLEIKESNHYFIFLFDNKLKLNILSFLKFKAGIAQR